MYIYIYILYICIYIPYIHIYMYVYSHIFIYIYKFLHLYITRASWNWIGDENILYRAIHSHLHTYAITCTQKKNSNKRALLFVVQLGAL